MAKDRFKRINNYHKTNWDRYFDKEVTYIRSRRQIRAFIKLLNVIKIKEGSWSNVCKKLGMTNKSLQDILDIKRVRRAHGKEILRVYNQIRSGEY